MKKKIGFKVNLNAIQRICLKEKGMLDCTKKMERKITRSKTNVAFPSTDKGHINLNIYFY